MLDVFKALVDAGADLNACGSPDDCTTALHHIASLLRVSSGVNELSKVGNQDSMKEIWRSESLPWR